MRTLSWQYVFFWFFFFFDIITSSYYNIPQIGTGLAQYSIFGSAFSMCNARISVALSRVICLR